MGISLTVFDAICRNSSAKGNARLVLIMLATYASEEGVRAGQPPLARPSQERLAALCNCSRSTIATALKRLAEDGEIRDTGERAWGKYRGTVVYELLPGVDLWSDLERRGVI